MKDPKQGLVDFYGRVNDQVVWLCWRFGEERIGHYHALDECFAARKPLPHAPPVHRIPQLMIIDRRRAARAIEELLREKGRDPTRDPALAGTGERVADAWADDLLAGYQVDVKALLEREAIPLASHASPPPFVTLRALEMVTMCPHHLLPSVGHVTVVFEPGANLVGVGTLSDLVDAETRRLALQEDITTGIADALMQHLGARGAAARLVLRHGCMLARGSRRHVDVETIAARGSLHVGGQHHASLPLLLGTKGASYG